MKTDKLRLYAIIVLTFTLLIGAVLYGAIVIRKGELNWGSILLMAFPLIIILIMSFFVLRRFSDVKKGLPLDDERSKNVMTKAAAKSFYISLYILLAISWLEPIITKSLDLECLNAGKTVALAIMSSTLVFFGFWFYYDRKGN